MSTRAWAMARPIPILLLTIFLLTGFSGCSSSDKSNPTGPTGQPLEFNTRPLRIGLVGEFWREHLYPTGGTTPYSYAVSLSDLPPGLEMEGTTDHLTIRGYPASPGGYTFTLEVTDKDGEKVDAEFTVVVVQDIDLSGTWNYTMTVTRVQGNCGETVGNFHTHTLTITQEGSSVTFAGFFDNPEARLSGEVDYGVFHDVVVSGDYPEPPGTLEGRHELVVYSLGHMEGTEYWSWTDGTASCTDSEAHITATRIR